MRKKTITYIFLIAILTLLPFSGFSDDLKRGNHLYNSYFSDPNYFFRLHSGLRYFKGKSLKVVNAYGSWDEDRYHQAFGRKNSLKPIRIFTSDGSGQAVHPDILHIPGGFRGKTYWLTFTPYPYFNDKFENPHILVSNDGVNFEQFQGLINPIVPPPEDIMNGGHYSDTDIRLHNGELIVYFVYNNSITRGPSKFFKTVSRDGVNWSRPELVYSADETKTGFSPAILQNGDMVKMWYVSSKGRIVLTESLDNEKTWTGVKNCRINRSNCEPWHIDIIKTSIGYEGLMCARSWEFGKWALFYIKSQDGIRWYVSASPILTPSEAGWDDGGIYRASLLKEGNLYRIWYSAFDKRSIWGIGYTEITENELKGLEIY